MAAPGSADALVVDYSELGSVALLADVPVDRLRCDPDVRALDALAGGLPGPIVSMSVRASPSDFPTAVAVLLFIVNFLGYIFGPLAIGALSDILANSHLTAAGASLAAVDAAIADTWRAWSRRAIVCSAP